MIRNKTIELLSPAKDADTGIAAVGHGADAVYIGAPKFGARAAAGNSVADIARLVQYAHRYYARVYVTLNTILYDNELEETRRIAQQMYDIGVDALIIQDMGLLSIDLPPMSAVIYRCTRRNPVRKKKDSSKEAAEKKTSSKAKKAGEGGKSAAAKTAARKSKAAARPGPKAKSET